MTQPRSNEESLTTIECSMPGARYTLFDSGPRLIVHLAGPGNTGGTGPCICGFDRHAAKVGFSVGGGTTGPGVKHDVCLPCSQLAGGSRITGLHAALFTVTDGCCPACDGTGGDLDSPETNGRCWDCRGTGHAHGADRGC